MDGGNLDILIQLNVNKLNNKEIPFIFLGVTVDGEKKIEKLSDLSEDDLINLKIVLKMIDNSLDQEFDDRENEKIELRHEIEKLINSTHIS